MVIRPNFILRFLQDLKLNNPLYLDNEKDLDNIPSLLIHEKVKIFSSLMY